nr:hypothetical protein [uncultured Devosia sp.]
MRITFALPLLLALAMPAFAQNTSIELNDAVPGFADLTYFDLARAIAPDLQQVEGRYEGIVTMPVRNLAYADENPITGLPLAFYGASVLTFTSGGTELVALLLEADAEAAGALGSSVLAIFDPAHPDQALDLADVASDQHTGFDEPAVLELGAEDDGLRVSSYHFNSSQGYRATSVLALVDGKLTEMASVFTFNENYCGMRRQQTPALAPFFSDDDGRWAPFTITVTEATSLQTGACDEVPDVVPATRAVAATFRWNDAAGAYEPDSPALADLFAETQARF